MFDSLSGKLTGIFERLTRRGLLTEADVDAALREIRIALLEADVALIAVKHFMQSVKPKAIGQAVLRSVTPGQMVIKIVQDELIELLGGAEPSHLSLAAVPPVPILMVGLQGSGKTTTTVKLARRLQKHDKKKTLVASLDVHRPAAQEQLAVLAQQAEVVSLPIVPGQAPVAIARRAIEAGRLGGFDVVILDTAGRLAIDEVLMAQVKAIKDTVSPIETLLVADAMTGQDAIRVAEAFHKTLGLTGITLTRLDGDGRGGAALSMRYATGCAIKLIGTGEKIDDIEPFHAGRVASRILGMGDVISLVEKAAASIEQEDAEALAAKMAEGRFDLDDMAKQLKQMRSMGGLEGIMAMLPGVAKAKAAMATNKINDKMLQHQEAIISSMTFKERHDPRILNASRKRRIAAGSGTHVQDVNKLLKQFDQMSRMMKQMKKLGQKGLMRQGLSALMPRMPGRH